MNMRNIISLIMTANNVTSVCFLQELAKQPDLLPQVT